MGQPRKVISILRSRMDKIRKELKESEYLPVSYLCVKYGSDVFVELLTNSEVTVDDHGLVSLVEDSDG